ncbi:clathrin light chain A-like protein [Babesia caballi]|uniref:Clathrin light chain n=1 Tax=Babesia caballi TaxID=5871 RepID=A0AAV4LQ00_BABCB|nr:clathrin light chain A-like protein [Babesia caballi]
MASADATTSSPTFNTSSDGTQNADVQKECVSLDAGSFGTLNQGVSGTSNIASQDPQKNDVMQKWRADLQKEIDIKKQKEADVMQETRKKAQEELDEWRRMRKEKLESKTPASKINVDEAAKKSDSGPFDWKKTADLLSKIGYHANDQSGSAAQKMADLITLKSKE